ncbi:MAG: type IV secretion system DNA-binding domain-containing protein, partial [Deltaproteobacteria bacterium]|nr:type IV secretion system DNA-binding domain-containing protein [Deltaproteobacteria bacterium]
RNRKSWQEFIEPLSHEQPLIHVIENMEHKSFEAFFELELEGIVKNNSVEDTEHAFSHDRFKNSLISCLSINDKLEFVYSTENVTTKGKCFTWKIIGSSTCSVPEIAALDTLKLWKATQLLLQSTEKKYSFLPVKTTEKLTKVENNKYWEGIITLSGVAIDKRRQRHAGFVSPEERLNKSNLLIVPTVGNKYVDSFNSVLIEALRHVAPIRLVFSINPFTLTANDLQDIGTTLEWLQNGGIKRINYLPDAEAGVDDPKIINGIRRNLISWLKNPSGFRINCKVMSEEPISVAFLKMVGNEIFHDCPVSVKVVKQAKEIILSEEPQSVLDDKALDLRDCLNMGAALPPLFPDVSTLIDYGVNRIYKNRIMNLPQDGIILGQIKDDLKQMNVRFSRSDRSRHCYVVGATGTGKSTLFYNMIVQDIENGEGVAVVDPHGDLYHQILASIPSWRMDDVVLVDPCDFNHSVGINFLEFDEQYKQVQINYITNEMIKIFDRLYDLSRTGGPIFEQYMRNALFLAMDNKYPGRTLMDIPLIFEDKEYREFLIEGCNNPIVSGFWERQAEKADGEASLNNMAPYVTCKLNQFTTNALLRPIIGQSKSTINFREIMDKGKILLVNLSKGLLGELDSQLLGMLIIGKIFSSAMGRVSIPLEQRRPMFLYVDEFQNFTTDTIAYLISEARKFGIHMTIANQNLAQLTKNQGMQNILDSVLGNVGTILMLRLGSTDADKMEVYTKPVLQANDLQELPDFHAAGRLLIKNAPSHPFVFKTTPMLKVKDTVDVATILNLSRKNYTRQTRFVEKEILEWQTSYKELANKPIKKIIVLTDDMMIKSS